MTKLALIDLDGTLADYDGAMIAGLTSLMSTDELSVDRRGIGFVRNTVPTYLQERERMVRSMPGFYRNLKPLPLGFAVLSILKDQGYSFHVATKAPRHNTAIASKEKIEWCEEFLPGVPVTVSGDKSILRGDILFDDWPGYTDAWLASNPNGLVIMPAQSWNKDHIACRTFKVYDNTLLQNIIAAIKFHESMYVG